MSNLEVIEKCNVLLEAYKKGLLGQTKMPEDSNPGFEALSEERIAYFTLPMALNYQRDSYKLWEAALKTWNDKETQNVFDIAAVSKMGEEELREKLLKYKLALQPNKHISTWKKISETVFLNFGNFQRLLESVGCDYIKLRDVVQGDYKKGFPYLSGPKIFNYWSFILKEYGGIDLKNSEFIEIAPDTHITKGSIRLGVIEDENISKDEISRKWREVLRGSGINPIDMHPPLWFWSRNNFIFEV